MSESKVKIRRPLKNFNSETICLFNAVFAASARYCFHLSEWCFPCGLEIVRWIKMSINAFKFQLKHIVAELHLEVGHDLPNWTIICKIRVPNLLLLGGSTNSDVNWSTAQRLDWSCISYRVTNVQMDQLLKRSSNKVNFFKVNSAPTSDWCSELITAQDHQYVRVAILFNR